jgi:hypothetical protein
LLLFIYALSFKNKLAGYVFHFWALAAIIFFMLVPFGTIGNDYYQIALVPPVAVFVGRALNEVCEKRKVLSYVLLALVFISSIYYMASAYDQAYVILDAGNTVDRISDKNDLIITTSWIESSPNILYYSNRKGWAVSSGMWSIKNIEQMKAKGGKFFVVAPQALLSDNPIFAMQIFSKYRALIGSGFVIFDLNRMSDLNLSPGQNDLSFKGSGALIGGNIVDSALGLVNITCYYNRTNPDSLDAKLSNKYYILVVDLADATGQIISEKRFLTSELASGGITRNNYVTSLSSDEKARISDVQVRLEEAESETD